MDGAIAGAGAAMEQGVSPTVDAVVARTGRPAGSTEAGQDEVAAFVAASWGRLYGAAYLMCGDAADAEDVVQTVMATVVERWGRIRRRDEPIVYARRVLAHEAYRRSRRRRLELDRLVLLRRADRGISASDPVGELVQRDELFRALQRLAPRRRAAVVLRFYGDMSEADTASALGCSVGTVKSQTSKGLARLRDLMAEGART
ncbi:SigE family RNA polymerase sigma factor [Jannaschia sp. R86511]|uniref:SigE family RNA polymerase sigma factor n=1 Tax=Jannaschia sp. R86511 TaxID=3093853 RepID=UPI0036D25FA1